MWTSLRQYNNNEALWKIVFPADMRRDIGAVSQLELLLPRAVTAVSAAHSQFPQIRKKKHMLPIFTDFKKNTWIAASSTPHPFLRSCSGETVTAGKINGKSDRGRRDTSCWMKTALDSGMLKCHQQSLYTAPETGIYDIWKDNTMIATLIL